MANEFNIKNGLIIDGLQPSEFVKTDSNSIIVSLPAGSINLSDFNNDLGAGPSLWTGTTAGNIYRNTDVGIGDFSSSEPSEALEVQGKILVSGQGAEFIGDLRGAVRFKAKAAEALSKGDVVYISGISGNTPEVSKADASNANRMPAFGIAFDAASLNSAVEVVTFGTLAGLDTSTPGFNLGDTLYVSTVAGQITNNAPTGETNLIQNIGKVQRVDASAGSIKVGGAGRTNATPNLNRGSLFIGNAANQSGTLAIGANSTFLKSNGTDANWSTINEYGGLTIGDSITGGTVNTTLRENSTNKLATGTLLDNGSVIAIGALNPGSSLNIEDNLTNGIRVINTKTNGLAKGAIFSAQGASNSGNNVGISVGASNSSAENIGGIFTATGGTPYAVQLSDGSETALGGKFLKDTGNGKANWANITASDISGAVGGSGTLNYIPKWTPNGSTLGDSLIQDNGTATSINETLSNSSSLGVGTDGLSASTKWAIKGRSINSSTGTNFGVEGIAASGTFSNIGGNFLADVTSTNFAIGASVGSTGIGVTIAGTALDGVNATSLGLSSVVKPNTSNLGNSIGGFYQLTTASANDNIGILVKTSNSGAGNAYALALQDGTQGAGKVLTSDAEGRGTWQSAVSATGGVDNRVAVFNAADTIEGDANFTWDGTELTVTDGTSSNKIKENLFISRSQVDDSMLNLYGYGNTASNNHNGDIVLAAANGTISNPTATINTDTLATIGAYGHSGTTIHGFQLGGRLLFQATEDHSGTKTGTKFVIETVKNSTSSTVEAAQERYAINGDGTHTFTGKVEVASTANKGIDLTHNPSTSGTTIGHNLDLTGNANTGTAYGFYSKVNTSLGGSAYGGWFRVLGSDGAAFGSYGSVEGSVGGASYGAYNLVSIAGTNTSSGSMYGSQNTITIATSGAHGASMFGSSVDLNYNKVGGTLTNAFGFYSTGIVCNDSGSTISNAYGVYLGDNAGSGTITNSYGIYQAGTDDKNYFAGKVGIGTTTPYSILDVEGSKGELELILDNEGNDKVNQLRLTGSDDEYIQLLSIDSTTANSNLQLGIIGPTNTSTDVGSVNDSFILASSSSNNLNIINNTGTGTTDNIAFYVGKTVGSSLASITPDLFILGNGTNKGRVGIGTGAPTAKLEVNGSGKFKGTIISDTASDAKIKLYTASGAVNNRIEYNDSAGAIRGYHGFSASTTFTHYFPSTTVNFDTGNFNINSSNDISINGTSSVTIESGGSNAIVANVSQIVSIPNGHLSLASDETYPIRIEGNRNNVAYSFHNGTNVRASIGYGQISSTNSFNIQNNENSPIRLYTNGQERIKIEASGNVDIKESLYIRQTGGTTPTAGQYLKATNGQGQAAWSNISTSEITGINGTTNQVAYFSGTDLISSDGDFLFDGTHVSIGEAIDTSTRLNVLTSTDDYTIHAQNEYVSADSYAIKAQNTTSSSNDNYGLCIEAQNAGSGRSYSIYEDGTDSLNVFKSNVIIGKDANIVGRNYALFVATGGHDVSETVTTSTGIYTGGYDEYNINRSTGGEVNYEPSAFVESREITALGAGDFSFISIATGQNNSGKNAVGVIGVQASLDGLSNHETDMIFGVRGDGQSTGTVSASNRAHIQEGIRIIHGASGQYTGTDPDEKINTATVTPPRVRFGGSLGYTFPAKDGTSGDVLTTDGNGTVSWGSGGNGGGLTPTYQSGTTYTASAGDLVVAANAALVITLPTATSGAVIGVKSTVAPTSMQVKSAAAAQTIDGQDRSTTGESIDNQWDYIEFVAYTPDNGTSYDWLIR